MSDDELLSPVEHDSDDADGDYQPSSIALHGAMSTSESAATKVTPVRAKRGRKPNTNASLRNAREAARKANHSVIEKKRREKINQALAELRTLVPADEPESNLNGKDFKLEVLVRTVSHLKRVTSRVNELERALAIVRTRNTQTRTSGSSGSARGEEETGERIQLPSVSALLMSLPTPPPSGTLSLASPSLESVTPLQLPIASLSSERIDSLPPPISTDEQAIHTLLYMSTPRKSGSSGAGARRTPAGMLDIPLFPKQ
ncbi:hypothetical protein FRC14_000439 [Serendipita sp. 396]|nr:hypothetical protein FRC14_000439 [Serendipita sp. 396]KAG8781665.1 hypothetical protein FRC15_008394 [Serendipita sp. 397]KAG8797989.1 hypothetical protein FRC16_008232 [Serendipita sp. 398]KAG8822163.1 hypothetical protein FRC19_006597 [Serendipita sp. 401]KAG8830904.1 hypothetical protein FRC18_007395 [Serendipita sp. 400]KAG8853558.1 hypothetical protein FRB91_004727 [Serendipita sp. 411]KAG8856658.1 hypothetical protein FRC20_000434 [Serendipita sp. 405]KAG9054297.1 hypothetical prot